MENTLFVLLGGIDSQKWVRWFGEKGLFVVFCAETKGEILEGASKFMPDAVVMNSDVGYGGDYEAKIAEALATIAALKGQHRGLPVLVFALPECIDQARKAGADFVFPMPVASREIPPIVERTLNEIGIGSGVMGEEGSGQISGLTKTADRRTIGE